MDRIKETQDVILHVNVIADAVLAIRQIVAASDNPSIYTEFAKELRIVGIAVRRMDDMLSTGLA